jgi:hypothetical protein
VRQEWQRERNARFRVVSPRKGTEGQKSSKGDVPARHDGGKSLYERAIVKRGGGDEAMKGDGKYPRAVLRGSNSSQGTDEAAVHLLNTVDGAGGNLSLGTEALVAQTAGWAAEMLAVLKDEADAVITRYITAHWEVADGAFVRLAPRTKLRREAGVPPGSFTVEWAIRYPALVVAGTGKRRLLSKYIRKGVGDRYTMRALRRHAQDWQVPLIEAAEDRLAPIRRQARAVIDVRRRLLEYAKLEASLQGGRGHDPEDGA